MLSEVERDRCTKGCLSLDVYPSRFETVAPDQDTTLRYWEYVQFPHGKEGRFDKRCTNRIASVERPYLGNSFLIIEALSCAVPSKPLEPAFETGEDSTKRWESMTQWGWDKARAEGVTTLPGAPSALTWSVESLALGETPRYVLAVSALPGSTDFVTVSTTVNGISLDDVVIAAGDQTDLVIEVPAPTIDGAPDDLVVVEFVLSDANGSPVTNTLRVSAIRLMS